MTTDTYAELLSFLDRLDQSNIYYSLDHIREGSMLVSVTVPGERWEVEFMKDGSVEVERFVTTSSIEGRGSLEGLFERFSD